MTAAAVLRNEKYQNCIDACNNCVESCEYCITSCCLAMDDIKPMIRCTQLCRDCADICSLTSQQLSRDSEFVKKLYATCADICDACAAECEKFRNMKPCQKCAQACRRCADECRKIAS
jgi:hypothetical protein